MAQHLTRQKSFIGRLLGTVEGSGRVYLLAFVPASAISYQHSTRVGGQMQSTAASRFEDGVEFGLGRLWIGKRQARMGYLVQHRVEK